MTIADHSFTIFSTTKVLWMNEKSINNAKEGKSLCISLPRKITHQNSLGTYPRNKLN
jgi:hypothetical protein